MTRIFHHDALSALPRYEYTDPSVLAGIAAGASWADPTMDPTSIDWAERQALALVPFEVVDGRPVSPGAPTGIRYGRNLLGHWGEQRCADALVIARTSGAHGGWPWLLMVERADGHGWALPGGYCDPGEGPVTAAIRELREETGLIVSPATCRLRVLPARVVPDPRASDEAWMVTTPLRIDVGMVGDRLPDVTGLDDARRAAWIGAVDYACVVRHLDMAYGGGVFAAHAGLLRDVLR
ncbi:NUDIX domain-containing protein [Micromonospora sp. RTGN7]|uniref:NUDIX domain-containing protein n=1 Tax=Micromonospora sp. RTGN7 TaxID=3016526 RepID=UPI0029FF270A|nr:NUDIX domain-containing protein [Micromonospora sp. RTGN7]